MFWERFKDYRSQGLGFAQPHANVIKLVLNSGLKVKVVFSL